MTNEELYKDEVEKIMKEDDTRHPAVRNGKTSFVHWHELPRLRFAHSENGRRLFKLL